MNDTFNKEYEETLGVDLFTKTISTEADKGNGIRLQVWDTSGQERFKASIPSYIKDCHVAIIPFDCTNRQQYDSIDKWIKEVSMIRNNDEVWIYIVATKCEKPLDSRCYTCIEMDTKLQTLQRQESINNNIIQYIETSAKAGYSIRKLFYNITSKLLAQVPSNKQ